MRGWLCGALAFLLAACDQGPVDRREPASWGGSLGRMVVDGGTLDGAQFERREGARANDGAMSVVIVDDAEFDRALRLKTLRLPAALDSLEASLATVADIEAGASCWLHLKARAVEPQIETGVARLAIGFGPAESRRRKIVDHDVYIEPTWTSIDIPFIARSGYEAGEARLVLGVGTQLQVIDVGHIVVRCFEPDNPPGGLPKTAFTYAGRSEQASWREVATSRIDRYRRGDLAIKVVDADDQPVPDAEIQVQMTSHAFKFGAAVDAELLAGAGPGGGPSQYGEDDTSRYRRVLQELFNVVSFENGMNWPAWEDAAQRRVTEDAMAWVSSLGLELRGGALVVGDFADLPRSLLEKRDDPEVIRAAVRERVNAAVSGLDGRIADWDVVDRPLDRHEVMDLLGWEEMGEWFRLARAAAAAPRLFLNESGILSGDRLGELAAMISELISRNAPIDAIGVQGHFGQQPPSIQVLSDRLDQLASFELPLMITEFDMKTDDPALLSDFTRDLMTLAFSHPAVEGFMFWGFWAGRQAVPQSAMYQQDWSIRANGEAYRDLVLKEWWTDEVVLSNAEGDLLTRAFLGDYRITARKDDLSAAATLTLGADGASITLKLG